MKVFWFGFSFLLLMLALCIAAIEAGSEKDELVPVATAGTHTDTLYFQLRPDAEGDATIQPARAPIVKRPAPPETRPRPVKRPMLSFRSSVDAGYVIRTGGEVVKILDGQTAGSLTVTDAVAARHSASACELLATIQAMSVPADGEVRAELESACADNLFLGREVTGRAEGGSAFALQGLSSNRSAWFERFPNDPKAKELKTVPLAEQYECGDHPYPGPLPYCVNHTYQQCLADWGQRNAQWCRTMPCPPPTYKKWCTKVEGEEAVLRWRVNGVTE